MMITEEYRALNARLHVESPSYGMAGDRHLEKVKRIMAKYECETVLDYGCGKGTLVDALGCAGYDPAIYEYYKAPEPADLVVCLDVMEHIEPECVTDVLRHISSLAKKVAYMEICTRPARKVLPDGRNAHICLHPFTWWLDTVAEYFGKLVITELVPSDHLCLIAHAARSS